MPFFLILLDGSRQEYSCIRARFLTDSHCEAYFFRESFTMHGVSVFAGQSDFFATIGWLSVSEVCSNVCRCSLRATLSFEMLLQEARQSRLVEPVDAVWTGRGEFS